MVRRKFWSQEQNFQVNSVRPDQIFDPGLKILALSLLAPACAQRVSNQGVGFADVEEDLVGEVYEYVVSGKYCDGASRERKRTIMSYSIGKKGKARQVSFAAVRRV